MFNDDKKGVREIIEFFTSHLKREYGLDTKDIQELLAKKIVEEEPDKILLPVAVFKNNFLSPLETITKYLKEERKLNYIKIASLLNRSAGPIGITYRNARKKMLDRLPVDSETEFSHIRIPAEIFCERKLSVLESLSVYLKDRFELTYHQVAKLLNRDDRTIWTVYYRAKKKRTKKEDEKQGRAV